MGFRLSPALWDILPMQLDHGIEDFKDGLSHSILLFEDCRKNINPLRNFLNGR